MTLSMEGHGSPPGENNAVGTTETLQFSKQYSFLN